MKICYIILTCEKFLETRSRWQRECCFEGIQDYYYLSCKPGPNNVYGWGTADDYESCPYKYIAFFKNMNLEYDWYVFIDDDAFVFPSRMEKTLSKFDSKKPLYIGCEMGHLDNLIFMSGGAGFVLSNPTYKLLKKYVRSTDMKSVQACREQMIHGDVSIGQWIKNVGGSVELVSQGIRFSYVKHESEEDLAECETFHYLKSEEDYLFYKKFITR